MAQSPAFLYSDDDAVDYTPAAAKIGGDVVVSGGIVGVTATDLAASEKGSLAIEGIFQVPKTTAAWVAGQPCYWNATGDPDSGDAGSGAANQIGNGVYMGIAVQAQASGDNTVLLPGLRLILPAVLRLPPASHSVLPRRGPERFARRLDPDSPARLLPQPSVRSAAVPPVVCFVRRTARSGC